MSASYYQLAHQHHSTTAPTPTVSHSHHGGRNRRAPRLSVSQNPHKSFRAARSMKDLVEEAHVSAFRNKYEAGRSFDLEDDMEFCPGLLTESDLVSIHSASERSSLASNSPESSPTQHPTMMAPTFSLNSTSPAFVPPAFHSQQASMKLHQPAATRTRNAIPIINPATGNTMASPPQSVSPARMSQQQQNMGRRW